MNVNERAVFGESSFHGLLTLHMPGDGLFDFLILIGWVHIADVLLYICPYCSQICNASNTAQHGYFGQFGVHLNRKGGMS